ncbi:MAG: tetratricopeptide repeat protein [Spirochaetia bacterium]|nr:tetratricopeptide repeat protein [Spirochaetia bacterium]
MSRSSFLPALLLFICSLLCASCATSSSTDSRVETHLQAGTALLDRKDFDASLTEFDKALALDRKNPAALYDSILALCESGKFDLALQRADNGFKEHPNYLEFLQIKARILYYQKNYREALDCYARSLALNPADGQTHLAYLKALSTYIDTLPADDADRTVYLALLEKEALQLSKTADYAGEAYYYLAKYHPDEISYQIFLYQADKEKWKELNGITDDEQSQTTGPDPAAVKDTAAGQ